MATSFSLQNWSSLLPASNGPIRPKLVPMKLRRTLLPREFVHGRLLQRTARIRIRPTSKSAKILSYSTPDQHAPCLTFATCLAHVTKYLPISISPSTNGFLVMLQSTKALIVTHTITRLPSSVYWSDFLSTVRTAQLLCSAFLGQLLHASLTLASIKTFISLPPISNATGRHTLIVTRKRTRFLIKCSLSILQLSAASHALSLIAQLLSHAVSFDGVLWLLELDRPFLISSSQLLANFNRFKLSQNPQQDKLQTWKW